MCLFLPLAANLTIESIRCDVRDVLNEMILLERLRNPLLSLSVTLTLFFVQHMHAKIALMLALAFTDKFLKLTISKSSNSTSEYPGMQNNDPKYKSMSKRMFSLVK